VDVNSGRCMHGLGLKPQAESTKPPFGGWGRP